MKLILATNNVHKISEMSAILKGLDADILSANDFDDFPRADESGETLEKNAIFKVRLVWEQYRLPCLADDTGLEVKYLNGAPGVISARFAGPGCSYDDNNQKLLAVLHGIPVSQRKARFRTVIAFMGPDGELRWVDGILSGSIAFQPKGTYGFGYDPIFLVEGTGRTLAEFPPEEKNRISHRSRALARIRPLIASALRGR